ncbi:glycosyltransferase [Pseudorhodobacter sp.]|uniref:glycosyltransferase n=1 Tax=Pseudorhodobacter sp. TaxID=1934400 RepID=UPI002649008A|nr:glycosyltransferase [Pseudorhodobacter sp.]MDN5787997.1 hypothetical protein [Pseudorhodobacter sp.]
MATASNGERRAIVCGVSADHAFALAALIVGFARNNPEFNGDFVVFHSGLSVEDQVRLRALWPRVAFHPFDAQTLSARFAAGTDLIEVLAFYSPLIFAKFEMLDLLDHYDQCLWLDVDMLIQRSLAQMWGFDGLAWRPLPDGAFARRAKVMSAFAALRGDGSMPLPNGGAVGMGQALRGRLAKDDLYAMAAQLMTETDAHSVDELALFFTAASRGLPLHLLDLRFNHPVVAPGAREAAIVHAIGPDKFWNSAPLQLGYPAWADAAQSWLDLGGSGYDGPQRLVDVQAATPDAALKAARNRSFWQGVYDALHADLPPQLCVDLRSDGAALRFYIRGLTDSAHLRLTRQPNERRIGVEVSFADDAIVAPALFARLDGVAFARGKPLELTRTKTGWAYGTVVPLSECSAVLRRIGAALDGVHATSRVKS